MDVTFLLIGILEEKVDKSDESHFDNMNDIIPSIILRVSAVRDMITNVCDIMEVGDDLFVRLSEEKVLAWMIAKSNAIVEQITENDKLRNVIVSPQGFKRTLKSKDASDDKKIRMESIRFLSEYLDRKWVEKLATHFEVIEEVYPSKGALSSTTFAKSPKAPTNTAALDFLDDLEAVEKKRKRKEDEEKSKKSKTLDSRSVASLKKVNTKGMKSLDSFFKKK
ncbi:predicted protein [Naegleria gruberi]|uniref:Predicted protein n=1 Tax=Naegleria gruberi TaxID=5762 RepID=D2UX89_NAEGR|nr:uncharacterized protein NAEGRDRAFT_61677 [Naegleria gruberi]EFC50588.1 predicted protein [Naegleria gruberi]|eukprot:XP_002683332.1 predicted protein [Naegleria gruberi strain NEG-M]